MQSLLVRISNPDLNIFGITNPEERKITNPEERKIANPEQHSKRKISFGLLPLRNPVSDKVEF